MKNSLISLFIFSVTLTVVLTLSGCKGCKNSNAEKIENSIVVPKDDKEFLDNLSAVLSESIPKLANDKIDSTKNEGWHNLIKAYYDENNYKPLWVSREVLNQKGKEMYDFVSHAEFLGLNKDLYDFETTKKIYDSLNSIRPNIDFHLSKELELQLTRSFYQMALHLDKGMFLDTTKGLNFNFWGLNKKYNDLLSKAQSDSIKKVLAALEPDNLMYNRFMAALRSFVSQNNISGEIIHIRDPKFDSIGSVYDTKKALVYHHYLEDSLRQSDSAFRQALKHFQKDNNLKADGTIGGNTIKALERDNSKKFYLMAINADRWRKEKILELPEKFVWVNLPSFKLKIIENDTLRLEKNVVIGKNNAKNKTPILESKINEIVLWPTWSVPQDIVKNEMKSFKGYTVTKKGNWTQVVQPPGYRNALGTVKILFPNRYSVYIHDTPTKGLFGSDVRAASHGCVRCQDPLEVAANLMQMDTFQITYDSLKAIRDKRIATRIFRLKKGIPVYFRYFTAEADFNGNMKFYADIYGRDKDMIDFIFKDRKVWIPTTAERRWMDSIALANKIKADSIAKANKLKQLKADSIAKAKLQAAITDSIQEKKDSVLQ